MITLHHLANSRSQRVLWMLEELGVDYRIERYERNARTMLAPPELRAVHPLGKSPVIDDDGEIVAETGAIIEYLAAKFGGGRLVPAPGTPEHRRYTYWLHYAEGSAMPPLLLRLVTERLDAPPMPRLMRPLARRIAAGLRGGYVDKELGRHLDFQEAALADAPWFAGDEFSGADIQMSFPLERSAGYGLLGSRPKLTDFLARIHARDAYGRALEKGGRYDFA